MVLGFYFSGDLFTILFASEDNRSFMGGSDVVLCVRVLLIGTTMAPFWTYWSVAWDCFSTFTLILYIIRGNGGPSNAIL